MAISMKNKRPLNALVIISEMDDALDKAKSDWEGYKSTGDINKLSFIADKQPTRFLVNFDLSGKQAANIKNSMISGRDEDGTPQVTLGTWSHRVVKYTLKDIQNPESLPADERLEMKKDENALVHDDLLSILDRAGLVDEIFGFYTRLVVNPMRDNAKN